MQYINPGNICCLGTIFIQRIQEIIAYPGNVWNHGIFPSRKHILSRNNFFQRIQETLLSWKYLKSWNISIQETYLVPEQIFSRESRKYLESWKILIQETFLIKQGLVSGSSNIISSRQSVQFSKRNFPCGIWSLSFNIIIIFFSCVTYFSLSCFLTISSAVCMWRIISTGTKVGSI